MARPTMKDVATRAGVSISTVSHALNDASTLPLADGTRARVRRIAEELGYIPNGLARSLQSQASRTIGVILGKPLTHARYAAIAEGVSRGLREEGLHLALLDEPSALAAVDDVRGGRLDGLVFIGHDDHGVPLDLADAVTRHSIPFVSVDCGSAAATHSTVDFDYAVGVDQVFDDLLGRGIRSIVYVRPDISSPAEAKRAHAIHAWEGAHPEIAVQTLSTGVTVDVLAAAERSDARTSHSVSFASTLASALADAFAGGSGDTARVAVVCAWGTDVEVCYRTVSESGPGARVAALAGGPLSTLLWPDLAYSELPLDAGGRAAARLIVAARRAPDVFERVILPPTFTATSPAHGHAHRGDRP